jgi:hypothetical protein
VLGIAGLLALFLTILFIVKRSAMFPAVAGVAWAVLAYLAIEFGFWNQIFDLQPGEEQVSRAIAEVVLAATLVLLLYAYLSLGAVHSAFFRIGLVWAAFFAALVGLAVYRSADRLRHRAHGPGRDRHWRPVGHRAHVAAGLSTGPCT